MSDRGARGVTGFIWFAAWSGLLTCWTLFICDILVWRDTGIMATCAVASLPAPLVGWLAFRKADRPLWLVTRRASLYALALAIPVALLPPATVTLSDLKGLIFVMGRAYFGPLALGLSGVALRLAWPGGRVVPWAVVYIVVGLVLVFPLPPISTNMYNPVGLFFPVWGVGVPLCVTIVGLLRGPQRVDPSADTEGKV